MILRRPGSVGTFPHALTELACSGEGNRAWHDSYPFYDGGEARRSIVHCRFVHRCSFPGRMENSVGER